MSGSDRTHPDTHEVSGFETLLLIGFAALIVAAPWPWGGNTPLVRSFFGLWAGILASLAFFGVLLRQIRPPRLTGAARVALLLWLLWLLWICAQLLPMGPGLLAQWSPEALQHHDRLRTAHPAPLYTLSIAPGQTVDALLDSLMLFCVYWLALLLANSGKRIRLLLTLIFAVGALQALYGVHMTVSGMEYGFFERKVHGRGWATGTFVNRNHFAAYLYLTAAAGIALVLTDLKRPSGGSWRSLVGNILDLLLSAKFRNRVMLVAVVVAVVLSRSRMGNVALFASLAAAGLVYVMLRQRKALVPALLVFGSLAAVDLWIVSRWFGLGEVVVRIETTTIETEQRPMVLQDLMPALKAYLPVGSGLGTFAEAYSPYRRADVKGYFDHAHNEYAEFLIETGWVGFGILSALVAVHLVHALRVMRGRRRNVYGAVAFAALMSSCALLLHGTVEFMLHIPAVALTWMVLLGMVAAVAGRSTVLASPERSVKSITPT